MLFAPQLKLSYTCWDFLDINSLGPRRFLWVLYASCGYPPCKVGPRLSPCCLSCKVGPRRSFGCWGLFHQDLYHFLYPRYIFWGVRFSYKPLSAQKRCIWRFPLGGSQEPKATWFGNPSQQSI